MDPAACSRLQETKGWARIGSYCISKLARGNSRASPSVPKQHLHMLLGRHEPCFVSSSRSNEPRRAATWYLGRGQQGRSARDGEQRQRRDRRGRRERTVNGIRVL